MGSDDNVDIVTNSQPFSIRNYVFTVRQKNIYHNWPFSEEQLQFCMKLGISRVLPPFEPCDSLRDRSNQNEMKSNLAQQDEIIFSSINNLNPEFHSEEEIMKVENNGLLVDKVVSKVSTYMGLLSLSSHRHNQGEKTSPSSEFVHPPSTNPVFNLNVDDQATKKLRYKRKKRKGKPKKRSMVDICAKASPCTLEDFDKINGSNWANIQNLVPHTNDQVVLKRGNFASEVNERMTNMDRDFRNGRGEKSGKAKHPRDENSKNSNVSDKRRCLGKIKLTGCASEPKKRRAFSLRKQKMNARHGMSVTTCKGSLVKEPRKVNQNSEAWDPKSKNKKGT